MRALLLALLAAAGALRPLQVDQAAVSKCIDKARPLEAGLVVQRRAFRERLGDVDARAADMLYDALTRGRGPTLVANAELAAWRASPSAFASAVAGARAYVSAIAVAFNLLQTTAYYVLFVASAARELLGRELLPSRGAVEPLDCAIGLAVAAAAAVSTTESLRGEP